MKQTAVKDKPCPFCGSYLKYKKGQLTICNNCKKELILTFKSE